MPSTTPATLSGPRVSVSSPLVGVLGALAALLGGCVEPTEPDYGTTASMATVSAYASSGCSTAVVLGLSKQIADEISCMSPQSLGRFSTGTGRIESTSNAVLPYLAAPAASGLTRASQSGRISINSAFRTVAQQYLLHRWYLQGRCGIAVAARPGRSNHESGRALDLANAGSRISAMRSGGWSYAGSSDPVHFDHYGSRDIRGQDVLAFQRLWNRNNPGDRIGEDGMYGPETEGALRRAPATGFATGASCATRSFGAGDAADVLAVDGPDLVAPGQRVTYALTLLNAGTSDWPASTHLVVKDGQPSPLFDELTWTSATDLGPINVLVPAGESAIIEVDVVAPAVAERTPLFTELTLSDGEDQLGLVPIALTVTPDGDQGNTAEGDDVHDDGEDPEFGGADVSGGCSAGGASGGLALLAPLLAVLRRRRRAI